jgi:hypothetical protein
MYQYFKRQLKTPTSSGSIKHASLKLLVMFCVLLFSTRRTRHTHLRSKFHVAKHRLHTQNITSNFSEARLILPEDGSQRIRNMPERLIVF